jgi:hypothetical protein
VRAATPAAEQTEPCWFGFSLVGRKPIWLPIVQLTLSARRRLHLFRPVPAHVPDTGITTAIMLCANALAKMLSD